MLSIVSIAVDQLPGRSLWDKGRSAVRLAYKPYRFIQMLATIAMIVSMIWKEFWLPMIFYIFAFIVELRQADWFLSAEDLSDMLRYERRVCAVVADYFIIFASVVGGYYTYGTWLMCGPLAIGIIAAATPLLINGSESVEYEWHV